MLILWIITIAIIAACVIKYLNKDYYILAGCSRLKTTDGTSLDSKIYTIPGTTIFGNNFDILNSNPETIFQFCRRNLGLSKGRSYVYYFLLAPIYNVANAKDAEEIFQSQKLITKNIVYDLVQPFLGSGLLTSTGQKWHYRRKILTPAFHFNILQSFIEVFKEESEKLVARLEAKCGEVISLVDVIPEFTLNNVCETALGVKLDNIEGSQEYRNVIHKIEVSLVKRLCNPLMYINWIYYLFGDHKELYKNLHTAHTFSSKIIEKKRKEYKNRLSLGVIEKVDKLGKKKRYAMLDTLLDAEQQGLIDHSGICDEVNTFMFEGYDTTSTCLIFTLMNLALRPDIQDKCYKEIKNFADLQQLTVFDYNKLEYLECVIKESLRLYPSVPFVGRQCVEKTIVNGLILPKTTQINIHLFDIMRDPNYFPDPLTFEPDRYLPENTLNQHPFAFVPFSAGPRNCIGQKFAILEMKAILASVIKNFTLLPVTRLEDIIFENGIVLRSQQQIQITFVKKFVRD